jgi:MoaA/NifB/PqqE/SkfB family radical SAM enzyme
MSSSEPRAAERSHQTKGLLRLTMACNERCTFCNIPVEDYGQPTPDPTVIDAELDAFIQRGDRTLTISGGEPTLLRKRLLALIQRARERGMDFVELQTNAVLIDTAYAAELADAGLTSAFISLLSHEAKAHDGLTLLEGSFERCIRGIDALISAGIRVALNPVLALETQAGIAEYVDFVAHRLPGVKSISLSAVQPHGRAGRGYGPELLPDYAVLREVIPRARERALAHGIELLNPYCGVPLCVGWSDDPEHSVEAFEALQGGWRPTPGVENQGDKIQGDPCTLCALRTRCGGAWRAYWELRDGSGIEPPLRASPPWEEESADSGSQIQIDALGGPDESSWRDLAAAHTPTVWLFTDQLMQGDAHRLTSSGCTDLAIQLDPTGVAQTRSDSPLARTLHELRQILNQGVNSQPQGKLRVWLGLNSRAPREDLEALVQWAQTHGVRHIRLLHPSGDRSESP